MKESAPKRQAVALPLLSMILVFLLSRTAVAVQAKKEQPKQDRNQALEMREKNDTVRLRNGTSVAGRVTKDDVKEILIVTAKGTQSFRQDEIEVVEYHAPREYREALEAFNTGTLDKAISGFKKSLDATDMNSNLQQYILYYLGLAHKNKRDFSAAVQSFNELRSKFSKTRFLRESFEQELGCHIQNENVGAARSLLGQIESNRADLEAQFPDWMRVQLADALMALGKKKSSYYAEARKEYSTLAGSSQPEIVARATAGEIDALLETKDYKELESVCSAKIQSPGNAAAAGHLGMGILAYRQAEEAEKSDKPDVLKAKYHKAVDHFVKATVQFPQHGKSPLAKIQLKAMWHLALLYEKIKIVQEKLFKQQKDPKHPDALALARSVKKYRLMAMYNYSDLQANYSDAMDPNFRKQIADSLNKLKQEDKD